MSRFTQIIRNATLEFHTDKMPIPIFENSEDRFGIIKINMEKTDPIQTPLHIYCNLDISESMNEYTTGSNRKINYIKQTMKLMLNYLVEKITSEIWIQIGIFSTFYEILIPMQILSSESIENMLNKIQMISVFGFTNIELALKETKKIMEEEILENPTHKYMHIFLTDGHPTEGNCNILDLSTLVSKQYPNLFIGYGCDHNSELLKLCVADDLKNSYQFVDNFEMTGQVYAEMLYSVLFCSINDPFIKIENGYIYDAKKDIWTQELYLPTWISEKEYIYHIKSSNIDIVSIDIYCGDNELLYNVSKIHELEIIETNRLDKFIFKQRTIELLSNMLATINNDEIDNNNSINQRRQEMSDFYKCIRTYMRDNCLMEDTFMKILCEDLVISYRSANTQFSEMHILSRRNAQATQSLYRSGSSNTRDYSQIYQPDNCCPTRMSSFTNTTSYFSSAWQQVPLSLLTTDEVGDLNVQRCKRRNTDLFEPPPVIMEMERDEDNINNYQDSFITENIYSPPLLEAMARDISRSH